MDRPPALQHEVKVTTRILEFCSNRLGVDDYHVQHLWQLDTMTHSMDLRTKLCWLVVVKNEEHQFGLLGRKINSICPRRSCSWSLSSLKIAVCVLVLYGVNTYCPCLRESCFGLGQLLRQKH